MSDEPTFEQKLIMKIANLHAKKWLDAHEFNASFRDEWSTEYAKKENGYPNFIVRIYVHRDEYICMDMHRMAKSFYRQLKLNQKSLKRVENTLNYWFKKELEHSEDEYVR